MPAKGQYARPRRICKQCQKRRVKKAEHKYCSVECARLGHRKPRPLCPVCLERPVKFPDRQKTCGRSCGARLKVLGSGHEGYRKRLAMAQRMLTARRQKHLQRLAEYLRDQVGQLDQAATPQERAKVLARVYHRGKHDGASGAYYRYVTAARRPA